MDENDLINFIKKSTLINSIKKLWESGYSQFSSHNESPELFYGNRFRVTSRGLAITIYTVDKQEKKFKQERIIVGVDIGK
jgi:aspartyl aminopeptidase